MSFTGLSVTPGISALAAPSAWNAGGLSLSSFGSSSSPSPSSSPSSFLPADDAPKREFYPEKRGFAWLNSPPGWAPPNEGAPCPPKRLFPPKRLPAENTEDAPAFVEVGNLKGPELTPPKRELEVPLAPPNKDVPSPAVALLEKLNKPPDCCDLASPSPTGFFSVAVDEKSPPLSYSFPCEEDLSSFDATERLTLIIL